MAASAAVDSRRPKNDNLPTSFPKSPPHLLSDPPFLQVFRNVLVPIFGLQEGLLLRDARLLAKHVTQQLPEAKMPLVREMVIKHMGGGGGGGGEPSDDKKKI